MNSNTCSDVHILITLLNQSDILRSMYDTYPWLKGDPDRRYLPFTKWLQSTLDCAEKNIAGALHFVDVISIYRDLFGADNITMITFDRLFRDKAAQADLCKRLGINSLEFSERITEKTANKYSDHGAKKLVRRVLGSIKGSSFLTPKQIRVIRGLLSRIGPEKKTKVSAKDRSKIEAFYTGQQISDLSVLDWEGMIL